MREPERRGDGQRQIRTSGSEGGAGRKPRSYLYLVSAPLHLSNPDHGNNLWQRVQDLDNSRVEAWFAPAEQMIHHAMPAT